MTHPATGTVRRLKRIPQLFLLLCAATLPAVAAELPGRLFTTAAERAALDAMRAGAGPVDLATPSAASRITLDGVVRRSSGKSTAWINQEPQHENQGAAVPGKAARPASAALRLPSGARVELQAGQTFDHGSGTVRDAYQGASAGR